MQYLHETQSEFEYSAVSLTGNEELHCHNRIEIIRLKRGAVRLRVNMGSHIYDVYEGDYAVIKSPDVHRIFLLYSNCDIEQIFVPVSYQNLFAGDYVKDSFVIPKEIIEQNSDIKSFIESSFAILSCGKNTLLVRSLCASLLSVLQSLYNNRRTVVSIRSDSVEALQIKGGVSIETMEKFDAVISHIDKNYTDSALNLPALSQISGLGKTFLSALFPRLMGRNFTSYIHHLRINRAIELITSTEKNISEIAYLCGFETIRSFNNVFKSIVGVSPSMFRLGLSGEQTSGLDTGISAVGDSIFNYDWTSNVAFEKDRKNSLLRLICINTDLKLWCHLRLRMLFFKGRKYAVTFSAKFNKNAGGEIVTGSVLYCNFQFPDKKKNSEYHNASLIRTEETDDGFLRFYYEYTIPDYYFPSSDDIFSIYSNPYNNLGVGFEVKDIIVKTVE